MLVFVPCALSRHINCIAETDLRENVVFHNDLFPSLNFANIFININLPLYIDSPSVKIRISLRTGSPI